MKVDENIWRATCISDAVFLTGDAMWFSTSCSLTCSCICRGESTKNCESTNIYNSHKVGVAVYGRYATLSSPPVSYLAHISGSVAGVTIGEILFLSQIFNIFQHHKLFHFCGRFMKLLFWESKALCETRPFNISHQLLQKPNNCTYYPKWEPKKSEGVCLNFHQS